MKTAWIYLWVMTTAGAVYGVSQSNPGSAKPAGVEMESATWSSEYRSFMGYMEGWEHGKTEGHWTAQGGGQLHSVLEGQDVNQVTVFTSWSDATLAPDRSVTLYHYMDTLGNEYEYTNYGSVTIALERGKLAVCDTLIPGITFEKSKSSEVKMMLHTGGGGGAGQQALVEVSASATEQLARPWGTGRDIPPPEITIEGLGKNLDEDGLACKTMASGGKVNVTPKPSRPMSGFPPPGAGAPVLAHKVTCKAAGNTNLDRTSLGVGERVDVFFSLDAAGKYPTILSSLIKWTTSAGSVSVPTSDSRTVLTAPSNGTTAKVTATVRGEPVSVDFGVEKPSGIKATVRARQTFDNGYVGAGMFLNVVLQPTSVSFNRVQIKEPGAAATGRTGYFIKHAPPNHDWDHGANKWHPVGCDNLVVDGPFDHAWSGGWPIGTNGSYTWPINPIWSIDGNDNSTNPLSGWTDQVHTLSADGTMTVNKLGRSETRSPY